MRSRYTAYVKGNIDYILDTHHPEGRKNISRKDTEKWAKNSEWLGLEILQVSHGKDLDDEGSVEFIAKYRSQNRDIVTHHELSQFEKMDGRWYFKDARMINNPQTRNQAKIGRNEACPCGSGKKYKHCCGGGSINADIRKTGNTD